MTNIITRYFNGVWYALIGRTQKQKIYTKNIKVVRAAFDTIIRIKQEEIQRCKHIAGHTLARIEQKKNKLKNLIDEIDRLRELKADATSKSESITDELRKEGVSSEKIKQHPDYIQSVAATKNFQSTLEAINIRMVNLEKEIEHEQNVVEYQKLEIQKFFRSIDKLKIEQSDTIDDLKAIRDRAHGFDMLSDITIEKKSKVKKS